MLLRNATGRQSFLDKQLHLYVQQRHEYSISALAHPHFIMSKRHMYSMLTFHNTQLSDSRLRNHEIEVGAESPWSTWYLELCNITIAIQQSSLKSVIN